MRSRVGDLLVRDGNWSIPGVAVVIDVGELQDETALAEIGDLILVFTVTPAMRMSVMGKTRSIRTTDVNWNYSSNYKRLETGDG
jgi:hypothetical protein